MIRSIVASFKIGVMTKRLFAVFGIKAYSLRNIPWGICLERDLERILSGYGCVAIIDVGANVGQTAIRFKKAIRNSQVWCFEPIEDTYVKLRKNTRRFDGIVCIQNAVGDKDGTVFMEVGENSEESKLIQEPDVKTGICIEVPMVTIDKFLSDKRIKKLDLLKTDCEGFDLDALKGASTSLESGIIGAVLCEVTLNENSFHSKFSQLNEYLVGKGYYFFAFYDYNGWGPFHSEGQFHNALWIRRQ